MTKKLIKKKHFLVINVNNPLKLWINHTELTIKCIFMTKKLFSMVAFLVISVHFMVDVYILWSILYILWSIPLVII